MNKFRFPAKSTSNLWNNRTVRLYLRQQTQQHKPTCRAWCGVWFLECQGKWMAVSFAETTCGLIRCNLFRENACCLSTCRRKPATDEKDHWRPTLQFKFMVAWWHFRAGFLWWSLSNITWSKNAYSVLNGGLGFALSVNWHVDNFESLKDSFGLFTDSPKACRSWLGK